MAEGKILGARANDSDQVYVPPRGSDPTTGAPTDVEVEVADVGKVTTFCVVNIPGLSETAPEIPYVCAQILLDGGNTPWFGLVQGLPADEVRMGMRVQPRFRAERVGYVTDLEAWVPLADGGEPAPAPPNQAAGEGSDEPVTGIVTPIRLEYEINAGTAPSRYLRGMAEGKILGARANDSDQVYVPPRGSDPTTGAPTDEEVEVAVVGTVTRFCVVNIPCLSETAPEIPYVCAQILLDGGNTPWFGLIQGLPAEEVRMGLRVQAVWAEELKADASNIKWFEPTGEPDADYETYKDYA
jgi:uncharacterized OB-fold protein